MLTHHCPLARDDLINSLDKYIYSVYNYQTTGYKYSENRLHHEWNFGSFLDNHCQDLIAIKGGSQFVNILFLEIHPSKRLHLKTKPPALETAVHYKEG